MNFSYASTKLFYNTLFAYNRNTRCVITFGYFDYFKDKMLFLNKNNLIMILNTKIIRRNFVCLKSHLTTFRPYCTISSTDYSETVNAATTKMQMPANNNFDLAINTLFASYAIKNTPEILLKHLQSLENNTAPGKLMVIHLHILWISASNNDLLVGNLECIKHLMTKGKTDKKTLAHYADKAALAEMSIEPILEQIGQLKLHKEIGPAKRIKELSLQLLNVIQEYNKLAVIESFVDDNLITEKDLQYLTNDISKFFEAYGRFTVVTIKNTLLTASVSSLLLTPSAKENKKEYIGFDDLQVTAIKMLLNQFNHKKKKRKRDSTKINENAQPNKKFDVELEKNHQITLNADHKYTQNEEETNNALYTENIDLEDNDESIDEEDESIDEEDESYNNNLKTNIIELTGSHTEEKKRVNKKNANEPVQQNLKLNVLTEKKYKKNKWM